MPAYGLFHTLLKKLLVAMPVGVQVMLCKSIHWPLSFQSVPGSARRPRPSDLDHVVQTCPPRRGPQLRVHPGECRQHLASLVKKLLVEMRLGGLSFRSVHPCSGTSSATSPAAPIDAFTKSRFMGPEPPQNMRRSHPSPCGAAVREIIMPRTAVPVPENTRGRGPNSRSGAADCRPRRTPGRCAPTRQERQVKIILHRDVLEAHERAALDPARRVDRWFVYPGRVVRRRRKFWS